MDSEVDFRNLSFHDLKGQLVSFTEYEDSQAEGHETSSAQVFILLI